MRPELEAIMPDDQKILVNGHNRVKLPHVKAVSAPVVAAIKGTPSNRQLTPADIAHLVGTQIRASTQNPDPDLYLTQPHPGFPDEEVKVAALEAICSITTTWLRHHHLPGGVDAGETLATVGAVIEQMKYGNLLPHSGGMSFPEETHQHATRVTTCTNIVTTWQKNHHLPPHEFPLIPGYEATLRATLEEILIGLPFNM